MRLAAIKTVLALCAGLAASGGPSAAQGLVVNDMLADYWQQQTDYDIRCSLDTEARMLTGTERLTYRNNSPDTLQRFYIHLYPNAYRDKDSDLYKDYHSGTWIFLRGLSEENRGWIEIEGMTVGGDTASYEIDGTILSGRFPKPLAPGATAVFDMAFREKIRKRIGRAGYLGNHFDMAQWYPKIAVYDKTGWHPDQFRIGEFYGEFGTYDVEITLPEPYVVAATGLPTGGDPGWTRNAKPAHEEGGPGGGHPGGHPGGGHPGGMSRQGVTSVLSNVPKTVKFRAVNVHDFAWCADPLFVVEEADAGDYSIRTFYRSWNRAWADSVLARTIRAMALFEDIVGPYEWPQISIVDSPTHGGMEYPMLVMNGSPDMGLIVHEVAHMWFYGMLANNERDEAWLDEGPAQYHMFSYLAASRGGETFWNGIVSSVIKYHREGFAEPVATPFQEFESSGRTMVYNKSALFFRALKYRVGEEDFAGILREYFRAWKFKHVDEDAFLAVCEDVTGAELGDFFKQWLHSAKNCDYSLESFKRREEDGVHWADVRIKRKGEMILPVSLQFRLENGGVIKERVDGTPREIEKSFQLTSRPEAVSINPGNEILDIYLLDNNSSGRRKVALENPWRSHWPPASVLYELFPLAYYNDVDGGKGGLRIKSSYDDTYRKTILQGMYGAESGATDAYFKYVTPVGWLGRSTTLSLEGFYREGRGGGSFIVDKIQRKSLSSPVPRHWQIRFVYHDMFDEDYVYPGTYDGGTDLRLGGGLELAPRLDIFDTSLKLDYDRSFWGSRDSYEKFRFEASLRANRGFGFPLKPGMRLWYGSSAIDPPVQERLNIAGAGVMEKEKYFWLRSVGAFPEDYYGNWHLPGNSNLRGYYDADYAFKKTAALNMEVGLPFWLPDILSRRLRDRQFYLFYDAGLVLDDRPMENVPADLAAKLGSEFFESYLQDFGIGIKLWMIKAEFPLWLSHPEFSGESDRWDARWTIGINSLF